VEAAGDLKKAQKQFQHLLKDFKAENFIEDSGIPMKLSILYMSHGEYDKAVEVLQEFKSKCLNAAV
jgi:hypothetical protein